MTRDDTTTIGGCGVLCACAYVCCVWFVILPRVTLTRRSRTYCDRPYVRMVPVVSDVAEMFRAVDGGAMVGVKRNIPTRNIPCNIT